jgi:vancomycin resistance protein YoaR
MRRPWIRLTLATLAGVVVLHGAVAIVVTLLRHTHAGEVLAGVHVDGIPVGGLDPATLQDVVTDRAQRRLTEPVQIRTDEETFRTDRAALGASFDVAGTVEQAWERGRGLLWVALLDQLRARFGGTIAIELELTFDEAALAEAAEQAAAELSHAPRAATVAFEPVDPPGVVDLDIVEPAPGAAVDPQDVADAIDDALPERGPIDIVVDAERTDPPVTTEEDLDAVLPDARRAVSAPITLTNPTAGDDLELTPADLAEVLTVRTDEEAPEGERLVVASDADRLAEHIGDNGIAQLETAAVDARFEVVGDTVEIRDGTRGFAVDLPAAADTIVVVATRPADQEREDELPGDVTDPDFTRQDAQDLRITEEVSSFTTPLVAGQPRNTNIHLGADILDGTLIRPGQRFSLNEGIGPRTTERGFVANGFIDETGEIVSVVGGGSSQLGTTFFNAAWFAGIEIVDFQPHSLYFERYPRGREATLSYNQIDVVVVNDSPYGILVDTSHTDTSVTISFWSRAWADVDSWTSDPYNVVQGEQRNGFDVDFGRTITYPDGTSSDESYFHRYQPQH